MPEPPSIATDTNVLLDYAREDETVIDCSKTSLMKHSSWFWTPPMSLHP